MQLQPCDHRRGCLHITKSSSMPLSPIDRRRPTMHSYQMQSTPVMYDAIFVCLFLHVYLLFVFSCLRTDVYDSFTCVFGDYES